MTEIIRPLALTATQVSDLEEIARSPAEDIKRIDDAIRSLTPAPIRASLLFAVAAQTIRKAEPAGAIVRQGLLLASYARHARQKSQEVVKSLELGLVKRWNAHRVGEFARHLGALTRLVDNDAIYVASKAVDLSFDHDRIMTDVRIIKLSAQFWIERGTLQSARSFRTLSI